MRFFNVMFEGDGEGPHQVARYDGNHEYQLMFVLDPLCWNCDAYYEWDHYYPSWED